MKINPLLIVLTLALSVLGTGCATVIGLQTGKQEDKRQETSEEISLDQLDHLEKRDRILVEMQDGRRLNGLFLGLEGDDLLIRTGSIPGGGSKESLAVDSIKLLYRIHRPDEAMLRGFRIGLAVDVVIAGLILFYIYTVAQVASHAD